ncbi:MAG: tetratricopeptide repeat protein [Elusimicrobia bacterium]|nr:tetratricopeptide repeat protein [Elusimicrobiota bacterium]
MSHLKQQPLSAHQRLSALARENAVWAVAIFVLGLTSGMLAVYLPGFIRAKATAASFERFADPGFFPRQTQEFPARGQIEKALAEAQKALETDPTDLAALAASGIAYYALGREHAVEALNRLEAARDYGSVDGRIPYYLAVLYDTVGLKPFAAGEYDRYLRNQPNDPVAILGAARVHFELEEYAQSAAFYERLLALKKSYRNDPVIIENLALASFKLKDWEKAKSLLEGLRGQNNHYSKDISYFLAESLRHLSRCPEALPYYDETLGVTLDASKETAVLEGKLTCLKSAPTPDLESIEATAQKLLDVDAKNKLAGGILKQMKKSKGPGRRSTQGRAPKAKGRNG